MAASAAPVLALALTFAGCGKPAAGPAPQTAPPQAKADSPDSRRDPAYLDEVLATWSSGNKEQAIEGFLRIDWQKKATFSKDSLLGVTEDGEGVSRPVALGTNQEARPGFLFEALVPGGLGHGQGCRGGWKA
jgi:hypothetical protein